MPMHGQLSDEQRRRAWARQQKPFYLFIGGSHHRQMKAVSPELREHEPVLLFHSDDHARPLTMADLEKTALMVETRQEVYTKRRITFCRNRSRHYQALPTDPYDNSIEERHIEFFAIDSMDDFDALYAAIHGLD